MPFKEKTGEESPAQIKAFTDTWEWTQESERTFEREIVLNPETPANVKEMVSAFRQFIGSNAMMSYLVMMTPRLVELRRVLKPTGSSYLHCDPTASHYLKLLMDAVFGNKSFLNEIIWYYRGAGIPKGSRARRHDVLLWYAKQAGRHYFNPDPISPNPPKDTDGRREGSGRGWVRELQGRWPGLLG